MPQTLRSLLLAAAILLAPLTALAQDIDCSLTERQVAITVQTTPRPSLPGQSVKIAIFVEPVNNIFDPTGTVDIFDDVTSLGTAALFHAQTALTETFYTAGAHTIHVIYNGDGYYCSSVVSSGLPVDRITPTISLASSSANSPYGALLTLTAQVGPAAPTGVSSAAGPVQFFDNGTLIGSADLVNGKSTFTTADLASGPHQLTATLIGDPNYYSVRTTPLAVTIAPAATATLLNASATASDVTFSINVNSAGVIPQTGTLRLLDTTANITLATLALPTVTVTLPLNKVPVGHPIVAVYSEGVSFAGSTSSPLSLAAFLNAAGASSTNIAPDEIVSLFGAGFSTATLQSTGSQLATTLGGIAVTITDRTGTTRNAGLYLVSPTQINFLVPTATLTGAATLAVSGAAIIPIQLTVAAVAPGIFTPPQALHILPDATRTLETVTGPISLDPAPGGTYLILYATGLRHRSSLSAVTATIGNLTIPVNYAGDQFQFPGLDQVTILLPDSLKSAGKVNLNLTVDTQPTNAIPLQFQ